MVDLRTLSRPSRPSSDHFPVLALHSLGLDGDAWAAIASLGPTQEICVYDQRAHGVSADTAPSSFQDFVTDAKRALDQIDSAQVHVVGHSLGGAVVACLAQDAPGRVASLSLIATPFAGLDAFRQRATAVADGTLCKVTEDTLNRWFGENASGSDVDFVRSKIAAMTPAGFDACWTALAEFAGYDALPGPFPPTLVCSFENDQSTPPSVGDKIAHSLLGKCPSVQHDVVAGAGHMGVLTHASDVFAILARHWQRAETTIREVAP
jgi:pimeloyl-ACP methyl ester carboxylesterase